jgi:hypothetical protein
MIDIDKELKDLIEVHKQILIRRRMEDLELLDKFTELSNQVQQLQQITQSLEDIIEDDDDDTTEFIEDDDDTTESIESVESVESIDTSVTETTHYQKIPYCEHGSNCYYNKSNVCSYMHPEQKKPPVCHFETQEDNSCIFGEKCIASHKKEDIIKARQFKAMIKKQQAKKKT